MDARAALRTACAYLPLAKTFGAKAKKDDASKTSNYPFYREFKEAAIERDATIDGTSIDELGEYDKDRVRQMFINNECSGKDIRKFGDWYVNDEGDMFYSPYKTNGYPFYSYQVERNNDFLIHIQQTKKKAMFDDILPAYLYALRRVGLKEFTIKIDY